MKKLLSVLLPIGWIVILMINSNYIASRTIPPDWLVGISGVYLVLYFILTVTYIQSAISNALFCMFIMLSIMVIFSLA
jgi:hypothetical protein